MPLPRETRTRRRRIAQTPQISTIAAQVQTKIEDLLDDRNMNNGYEPPPFSMAEMIVIAFVTSGRETLLLESIVSELLKAFPYYARRAIDQFANACFSESRYCLSDNLIAIPGFYYGFDCGDAPLFNAKDNTAITSESVLKAGCLIKSPIADANIYLSKWLKNDKPMDLFAFPAELRNKIFEQVFAHDWPGLLVRPKGFKLLRRATHESLLDPAEETLSVLPVQTLMALVSVNQQCYKEALPLFYSANWFVFDTPSEYCNFVRSTTDNRLGMLRHMIVSYNSTWRTLKGFDRGARALAALTGLRDLELNICDNTWFDPETIRANHGTQTFMQPSHLPGIEDMAYALYNAARFRIRGQCPKIKGYLETKIAQLKTASRIKEVERLREAERRRRAKSYKELECPSQDAKTASSQRSKTPSGPKAPSRGQGSQKSDMELTIGSENYKSSSYSGRELGKRRRSTGNDPRGNNASSEDGTAERDKMTGQFLRRSKRSSVRSTGSDVSNTDYGRSSKKRKLNGSGR